MSKRVLLVTTSLTLLFCCKLFGQADPYCLSYQLMDSTYNLIWYFPGVNSRTHSVASEADWYYLAADFDTDARAIVEFTDINPEYPIEAISLFIWGEDVFPEYPGGSNSPFGLAIYNQLPTDFEMQPVWGEEIVTAVDVPPEGDWCRFPIHQKLPASESLYIQFRWLEGSPAAPLMAMDYMDDFFRSYLVYRDGDQFQIVLLSLGNILVRLHYNLPDTGINKQTTGVLPDSFSLFVDSDSIAVVTKEGAFVTITDSLHLSLPITDCASMYTSTVAWKNEAAGQRCAPIYMPASTPLFFPLKVYPESLVVATIVGECCSREILLSNLYQGMVTCSISVEEPLAEWLELDSRVVNIEPTSTRGLQLDIDSKNLAPGDYFSELILFCSSQNEQFASATYRVINQVSATTSVDGAYEPAVSDGLQMQNYPNPFNSSTTIWSTSRIPIRVYNTWGRLVTILRTLNVGYTGYYKFVWNGIDQHGSPVASGVYFYSQSRKGGVRKMLLLK